MYLSYQSLVGFVPSFLMTLWMFAIGDMGTTFHSFVYRTWLLFSCRFDDRIQDQYTLQCFSSAVLSVHPGSGKEGKNLLYLFNDLFDRLSSSRVKLYLTCKVVRGTPDS